MLIEAENRDARFEGGPHDGQVRPVILGAMSWRARVDGAVHVYHCKRTVARGDVVLGFVFRYVGRER